MASPLFDDINQKLSLLLVDYVAAAAADGKVYTAVDRSQLINQGTKTLFNLLYADLKSDVPAQNIRVNRFNDFIIYASLTASSGTITITGGNTMVELIKIVNTVTTQPLNIVDIRNRPLTGSNRPPFASNTNDPYVIVTSSTTMLTIPSNSDLHTLTYLKTPNFSMSVAMTNDIEWNATFFEDIKLLAQAHALKDDGNYQGYISILQAVANELNISLQNDNQ